MKTKNLTYTEALEALSCNLLVKLPEWDGHWFTNTSGNINVFTSNGKIVETPYLDDYKSRTDWLITDGSRDFGGAIRALKAGKTVHRKGWNGKNMFLEYVEPDGYHDNYVGVELLPWIGMKTANNMFVPWTASQEDQLAIDWFVL